MKDQSFVCWIYSAKNKIENVYFEFSHIMCKNINFISEIKRYTKEIYKRKKWYTKAMFWSNRYAENYIICVILCAKINYMKLEGIDTLK